MFCFSLNYKRSNPNVVLRNDNESQLHRENVFKARGCLVNATFLKRGFYRQ